jgi:transcriptional regulator with XRE-family HTH domain
MPAAQSAPREALSFGQMFREARLAARRSGVEVGRLLGCSGSYICLVEEGKRGLDRRRVEIAARLFEVDPTPLVRASVLARGELTIKTSALPDKVIDLLIALADGPCEVARN